MPLFFFQGLRDEELESDNVGFLLSSKNSNTSGEEEGRTITLRPIRMQNVEAGDGKMKVWKDDCIAPGEEERWRR